MTTGSFCTSDSVGEIRPGYSFQVKALINRHEIDLKALKTYLQKNVTELSKVEGNWELQQFMFGQSNPTYLITAGR